MSFFKGFMLVWCDLLATVEPFLTLFVIMAMCSG